MKKPILFIIRSLFLIQLIFIFSCVVSDDENFEPKKSSILINQRTEKKVDSVLSLMTLDEKIGQLVQYAGSWDATGPTSENNDQYKLEKLKKGEVGSMLNITSVASIRETQRIVMENSRLKIPLIFAYDVIHGYKTMFPVPLAESASWDLGLIEKSARVAAKESAASGLNWTFAPMVDISRDARWGRIMEGSGEDPYLGAQIAKARIQGFQGKDLGDLNTIAACAKHFAGYGLAEAGKDYNTVNLGENELHNVVLPPFKAAAEVGVATFMNSFNEIDGIPATGHKVLQRDLLKGKWNWEGFVVSDWGSIQEMQAHGYARDLQHAAEIAIKAGSDMDMQSYAYESSLKSLVENGTILEKYIDDAVRRILRIKFQLGLFDNPYKYCDEQREKDSVYTENNLKVARKVAKKSIVLLKNEDKLLPLSKTLKSIAVIGPFANDKDTPLGNWRAQAEYNSAISLLEGVKSAVSKDTEVFFEKGVELTIPSLKAGENQFLRDLEFNTADRSGIKKAVEIAKKADVVLLAIGENAYQSGEGRSQADIGFKGLQLELLDAVYEVNQNVVIILMNGRPMDLTYPSEKVSSILECWHLGSMAGYAIADIIFGDYNPSGKLPVSFPHHVGQEPLYYNHKSTGRPFHPKNVTYASYRDVPNEALYPFGYGLSYTTFTYSNLRLSKKEMGSQDSIELSVEVTNTGDRAGEEVVQLYIRDLVASVTRPVKELKAFQKIDLNKGETRNVKFTIDSKMLEFYSINKIWEVEPGDFDVWVGGHSETDLKMRLTVY